MQGVNLLKIKGVETIEELRLKKIVYFSSIIISVTLILVAFVVFLFSARLNRNVSDLNLLNKQWTNKISSYSDLESYSLVISQKLAAIKKIKNSADFYGILSPFSQNFPQDLNITSLTLTREGLLSIDGSTQNSSTLIAFFDSISQTNSENLRSLVLTNLILSKEGLYRFSLNASYAINNKK